MRSGPALALFALLLAQVPWLPCHCASDCVPVPALRLAAEVCDEPHAAGAHAPCPAHHCPSTPPRSREHGPGERSRDHDPDHGHDHDFDVAGFVAVARPSGSTGGAAPEAAAALHATASTAPPASLEEGPPPARARTGPLAAPLATVRLLL